MKKQSLSIDLIRTDGGTQMRAELDRDVYIDYRDKFLAGADFPEVDVFHDGSEYWLADGFHRFYGAREAKRGSIKATVHSGTVRDAILFAVGANQTHGMRRSNADKRNSVLALLNDETWVTWSDNKIADQVGVGVDLVGTVRKQLSVSDNSSPAARTKNDPKEGKDGKKYPASKPKAGKGVASEKPQRISGGTSFDTAQLDAAKVGPCPKGGEHEADEDGDCRKCKEPGITTFAKRVRDHNLMIERLAGAVRDSIKEQPPSSELEKKWTVVVQQVQSVCGTIRTCKVHDKPCPKCDDNGKPCKVCGGCGMVTKITYDGMGGK